MNLTLDHFTSRPGALLPGGFLFGFNVRLDEGEQGGPIN